MKTKITTLFIIVMMILLATPNRLFAQAPDTVYLSANPPGAGSGGSTFEQFIAADTTATGGRNNPNRVYVLQQTGAIDTPYYYQDPIYTSTNLTIIGKLNPTTGMPPVIQPGIRQNNSSPSNLIVSNAKGIITLKDLYILGTRYDSLQETGNLINSSGDSTVIILDHCVFDNLSGNLGNFNGNWCKFFLTNCEYRNASNQFWQAGNGVWANNGVPLDTVIIRNNTFFGLGRAAYGGPGYYGYLLYEHNTNFLGTGGLLLSTHLTNAVIRNNIFYGVIAHGADTTYISKKGANDAKEGFGVVMMDSLGSVGTLYGFTEAQRNVVVKNNAYCWPQALYTYWSSLNNANPNTVVIPQWMNPRTAAEFKDKTNWPGFASAKNDSVDPGFAQAVAGPAVDSLVKFVSLIGYPPGNAGTFRWWVLRTNPYPGFIFSQVPSSWKSWSDGYPVPEDLRYSNTALQTAGTDGKALGDLNWFPEQLVSAVKQVTNSVPASFELSQNYPNPFNPTTNIKYSISQSGYVALRVYNILGQEVATLFQGFQKAGSYRVDFDGSQLASGVYLYRLQANGFLQTKKMILMK